jgi:integrase/recombinase XerD
MHLRGLRRAMKLALKRGLITQAQYPFADGKFEIRTERKKKKALSKEKILKFLAYKPTKENQIKAHDFTVFSYLCNGMNFADIANLQENTINFDHFNFIRQKTMDTVKQRKQILVVLTNTIKAIISRQRVIGSSYLFGIICDQDDARTRRIKIDKFIQNTNRAIKSIAKKLGFEENITTYTMRHTFVSVLLNKNIPLTKIADALGHMSVVTTAIYAEDLDFDTAKLFGGYLEGTDLEESPTTTPPQPLEKAA